MSINVCSSSKALQDIIDIQQDNYRQMEQLETESLILYHLDELMEYYPLLNRFLRLSVLKAFNNGDIDHTDVVTSLSGHPIYGTATWHGDGNAVGASVQVVSSQGTLTDYVDYYGEWNVDCGDPYNWPPGTSFKITIIGCCSHNGWTGRASGVVSGDYNNIGNIVLYPPVVANANGPYYSMVDKSIQFTGTGSNGIPPYSWSWKFGDNHGSNEQNPTYTYTDEGMYPVTLSITDSVGSTDEDITWAEIVPELKAYTNGPYNGTIGSQVQFNGSASGGALPYTWWEWDFGDGNTSTMQNPTHIYTTPGNHTVILTVHDNDYNTGSDRTWVFIKDNSPPVLPIISGPTSGIPGEEYRYTFTSVDPDGDDLYYWILWGDDQIVEWNGPYQSGREVQFTHVYLSQGTYTISVKAKDTHEDESHWSYLHITMPKNKLCNNPMLRIFVFPFLPKLLQYHILEY